LLLRALVHDQCRSGIRQVVKPLVAALGYRPAQEALISYVEAGTAAEAIGAAMAWYWARPTLVYLGTASWRRRQPTADSKAAWDSLADPGPGTGTPACALSSPAMSRRCDPRSRWVSPQPSRVPR
jgi:hypothetical protein